MIWFLVLSNSTILRANHFLRLKLTDRVMVMSENRYNLKEKSLWQRDVLANSNKFLSL